MQKLLSRDCTCGRKSRSPWGQLHRDEHPAFSCRFSQALVGILGPLSAIGGPERVNLIPELKRIRSRTGMTVLRR